MTRFKRLIRELHNRRNDLTYVKNFCSLSWIECQIDGLTWLDLTKTWAVYSSDIKISFEVSYSNASDIADHWTTTFKLLKQKNSLTAIYRISNIHLVLQVHLPLWEHCQSCLVVYMSMVISYSLHHRHICTLALILAVYKHENAPRSSPGNTTVPYICKCSL